MKRLLPAAAALIALSSPVHAADSFSFVIGGHRIHIDARDHCRSGSCVSISIPGITPKRARPDDGDRPIVTSAITPAARPALCAAPSVPLRPAAPLQVAPPPPVQQPQIQPVQTQPAQPIPPPVKTAAITPPPLPPSPPLEIVRPAQVTPTVSNDVPKIEKVSQVIEDEPADSPLGDWHAEGQKGLVRIEPCGQALCGYSVDATSNAKGETVLVDMKSKTASQWSGNIYSRGSGNTYYGTITLKGPDKLEVEACALGHFFCSGTLWRRADARPKRLISDRETPQRPRS